MPKKKNKMKRKLIWTQTLKVLVSVTPLVVYFIVEHDYYFSSIGKGVSLGIGGTIAIVAIILVSLGKVPKKVKGIVWLGFFCILSFIIRDILSQICWILLWVFVGELSSRLLFGVAVKRMRERIELGKNADAVGEAVAKNLDGLFSRIEKLIAKGE